MLKCYESEVHGMDFNGMPMEGMAGIGGYPFGFMEALAMDERLMTGYNGLTEAQKEEMIFKYKDAKNDDEKHRILSMLMPEEDSIRAVCRDGEIPEDDDGMLL